MTDFLKPEDYTEPVCPLCEINKIQRIDVRRIIEKLDAHLAKNDQNAAERHLRYWLAEAQTNGDGRGALAVQNELMGLYRKNGREQEAMQAAQAALALVKKENMEENLTGATAFLNAATVYKAFDKAGQAMPLYRRAQAIYEANLQPEDERLAGLYNNMALALVDEKQFDEAKQYYRRALAIAEKSPTGCLDCAVTWLNLASAVEEETGLEAGGAEIAACVQNARELIENGSVPKDGYYAFVCEKCASVFGYYGYFRYQKELTERAKKIYERA